MYANFNIFPQSTFGLAGYRGLPENLTLPLYGYEANPSNFSNVKDWGISFSYGSEFSETVNSNLYSISLAKKINGHAFTGRFTPGYQKEFIFNTGESIVLEDSTTQSLEAKFTYKEIFGFGYSYKFTNQLSAGFTFRFFNQEINQEIVKPVFGDTLYLVRENLNEKVETWKGDIGIDYNLNNNFSIRAASINLFNFGDAFVNEDFREFKLKHSSGAMFGASYTPIKPFNLHFVYETSQSFQASITGYAGDFSYGATIFHDRYQTPVIAGVIPSFGYKTDLLEVILSGVKYFSNRKTTQSFSTFRDEGIYNILNNRYSFDKLILSVAFTISSVAEKRVELIDVEIVEEIYPTFYDSYLDFPFAYGILVNLTDEHVTVKPLVKIEGLNDEKIQSPVVIIDPFDTLRIPFYTIIPEGYSSEKPVLSYADFYVTTVNEEPDDRFQKATLVNSVNAWDGKVSNLRYFIMRDITFSMDYSKTVLSDNKELLDTLPSALSTFHKAKLLFNDFIKRMVYTSDPRATAEYVQFPQQTVQLKGGDCDDLSVCYSSLLESVGIQTALVDYKADGDIRHVNILFNTKLSPNQAILVTNNDTKYFVRENSNGKSEVWLPVESTSLTDFNTAWNVGVEKFNKEALSDLGIATGNVEIIDVY
jgi:transglutaminase-like putative cysteine protease